ncbi:SDR family oxidoreductase [Hymenobacter terrenus]|uniref:SDR family oxidoreductase n=1 Tax=Hymenobacter terrenus TaxID=1629124 RepID=UPI00061973EA|nr:SDR family oxidoreductase [Hymenobacter terrenus]
MSKLQGKTALITGGNSGIGLATAKEFLAQGADQVIITGRNQQALDLAVQELGDKAQSILCDSTQMTHIRQLAEAVKALTPSLDIIYINAGISEFAPLEHITEDHYDHVFGTNVKGVVFTVQQLLPLLNEGASIILCSTAGVQKGFPGASVYVASKAALAGFIRIWATELAGRKIRVNSISPGFTNTPLFDKVGLSEEQKQGAMELYNSKVLMGRFALPDEIAKSVTYLASNDSSYVTGTDLLVDGGYKLT